MTTFHLQIATMDGNVFDGQVQSVSCRTIHGDLAILARKEPMYRSWKERA